MDVKISQIANELFRKVSPVREIMNFADPAKLKEYGIDPENLISFGGGWVNHYSPDGLRGAYKSIIEDKAKFHFSGGYSPTNGEPSAKEALIKFERAIYNIQSLTSRNIVIGHSSSHLTSLIFNVLLDPGDRICLLDPSYCNYPLQVRTSTASHIIRFPVIDEKQFEYIANQKDTISRFVKFLHENKPKIVLLISPDNPTSQVLSDEFVSAAHNAVKEYGGVIVMDFAYKELVFGKFPEYFSWGQDGNFISVRSNSKWCRGLGRRLGWIEAPENVVEAFESLQNSTILAPDRIHQMAMTEYVSQSVNDNSLLKYINETRQIYKETAQITTEAIKKYIGLPFLEPQGGLYTCIHVNKNSAEFVEEVLKKTAVLLVPGWGFGRTVAKSVRLSYGPLVYNHKLIDEGLKKVGKYLGR
jgi:aspartate/methionine/tyrosine aminotransferase